MSLFRSTLIVFLASFFAADLCIQSSQLQAQNLVGVIHGRKRVIGCIGPRARGVDLRVAVPAVPFGHMYYALPMFAGPHVPAVTSEYPSAITAYDSLYRNHGASKLGSTRVINPSFYDTAANPNRKIEFPIIHTLDLAKDFQLDAEKAFRKGNYWESATLVAHAIQMDPANGLLKLFSSQANFASARYRIAVTELKEATNLLGTDEWGFFGDHFQAFYGHNDYVRQTRALAEYVERRPDDYQAKVLLGYHYGIAGHRTSATELFHAALRLNPQDGLAQRLIPAIGDRTLPMSRANSIQAPSPEFTSTRIRNYKYGATRTVPNKMVPKRIYLTSQFASAPSSVHRIEQPMSVEELIEAPSEVFIPQLDGPQELRGAERSVLEELPAPLEGK